jgi:hypothetical protein
MNCFDRGHIARNCPQDRLNRTECEEETNHARHQKMFEPTDSEFEEEGRRYEEYEEGLSSPSSDHGENTGDLIADMRRYEERERQRVARRRTRPTNKEESNRISLQTQFQMKNAPDEELEEQEIAEVMHFAQLQDQFHQYEQNQENERYQQNEQAEIIFDLPPEQQQQYERRRSARGQDPEWGA